MFSLKQPNHATSMFLILSLRTMAADLTEFKTFNSQCIKHNIVIVLMRNFYCHKVDHLFVLSLA